MCTEADPEKISRRWQRISRQGDRNTDRAWSAARFARHDGDPRDHQQPRAMPIGKTSPFVLRVDQQPSAGPRSFVPVCTNGYSAHSLRTLLVMAST
jgi:hypothetical protein